MTKENYMALADVQELWTSKLKPYIVAGFIAMLAGTDTNAKNLVLADGTNIAQSTFIAATEKGANSGVATLDATGKVPSSQLPSFVDDVIEAANFAALPAEGEGGKIYVTLDDNKTYRWGGTAYAEISASIALGETAGTAYEGSKGAANAAAIASHTGNSDIHVTTSDKAAWGAKYDKPSGGIPSTDMTAEVQASLALADTAIQQHQDISGKADKVASATNGNFAGLDANGNLTDSGAKASDFATAAQGGKADTAIQSVKVNGTALTPDANKAVDIEVPNRVTAQELAAFVV
ncbi:hypothetical protein [Prevotella sp. tc2-28]|uniref:hypothetical protein n=1 Tax=Prevotella sp. tc2-28 TaxID=1761888 RepID=UPI00115FC495|nr:hypothetical protein [Prevotella sp. tc2-28]